MAVSFILLFAAGFILSFFISFFLSKIKNVTFFRLFLKKGRVQDIHQKDIFRIGGICIFFTVLTVLLLYPNFPLKEEWLALILGMIILFLGGILDDIFDLSPLWQFLFQGGASAIFIFLGNVKISSIQAPFIGQIYLSDTFSFLLAFLLIIFFINIFNFLDGIDGIAAAVGLIGFLTIYVLTAILLIKQVPVTIFALIFSGALLGLLFFNKPPAQIFLGTSGSNLIGFCLGALSIIAGSKILTLLIVLILPSIDALIVIWQRFLKKRNIFQADKSHLHHILLKKNISQEKIFVFYTLFTAFFALGALFLKHYFKFVFFVFFIIFAYIIIYQLKQSNHN